jgi:coenzyme F420-reducing hydrogenase beta subunit
VIADVVKAGLCMGCGLCAAACAAGRITMRWGPDGMWHPTLGPGDCTRCGACRRACPCSPEAICEQSRLAARAGAAFGLDEGATCLLAADRNREARMRSASGGAVTAVLQALLERGDIGCAVVSVPREAPHGRPHFEACIVRTAAGLDACRGSHYHPLSYDRICAELAAMPDGAAALVALPCVLRGIGRMPESFRRKIRWTIALACSHSVSGLFVECLADQEGVPPKSAYSVNLRDKRGAETANAYGSRFCFDGAERRSGRFASTYAAMWRSWFFALESCLFCPDFLGAGADLSAKDAWGLGGGAEGLSALAVRSSELLGVLRGIEAQGRLDLAPLSREAFLESSRTAAEFKHIRIARRMTWKAELFRPRPAKPGLTSTSRAAERKWDREYWRFRLAARMSTLAYRVLGHVPVRTLRILSGALAGMTCLLCRPGPGAGDKAAPEAPPAGPAPGGYEG